MKHIIIFCLIFYTCSLPTEAQNAKRTANMVWVNGGNTKIGLDKGNDNEKPVFETTLMGFWIDVKPVSVGNFRKFIRFNQYITTAEKQGFAMCYDSTTSKWIKVQGANWAYPEGTQKPAAKMDEPVRQISWYDAFAYANWVGKRLPTELEWERALQNTEKLQLAYTEHGLWQWCDNWYFLYSESNYFTAKLNRPKSLRAGRQDAVNRPSLRYALNPEECFYQVGFRCAKDK